MEKQDHKDFIKEAFRKGALYVDIYYEEGKYNKESDDNLICIEYDAGGINYIKFITKRITKPKPLFFVRIEESKIKNLLAYNRDLPLSLFRNEKFGKYGIRCSGVEFLAYSKRYNSLFEYIAIKSKSGLLYGSFDIFEELKKDSLLHGLTTYCIIDNKDLTINHKYKPSISKKDLIFFSLSKLDYNQALNFISKESQSEGFIIASKIPYENSIIMSCDKYFCKLYVDNYTIYK